MDWTKKDKEFAKEININKLKVMYKKEKHTKAKLRLLVAVLRKE